MIINKLLKVSFNDFRECLFIEVKVHISETLGTIESVHCPKFRGGCFLRVAYVLYV